MSESRQEEKLRDERESSMRQENERLKKNSEEIKIKLAEKTRKLEDAMVGDGTTIVTNSLGRGPDAPETAERGAVEKV